VKVRELLEAITDHAEDGARANDEVVLLVGRERRSVSASYSDGTFILVAGAPLLAA
jgi:hypothetical protein